MFGRPKQPPVRPDQVERLARAHIEHYEAGMVAGAADLPEQDRQLRAATAHLRRSRPDTRRTAGSCGGTDELEARRDS